MIRFKRWLYNEENSQKQLNVATATIQCDRDPDINQAKIINTINQIMKEYPDTELIVFGEMILGWYDPLGAPDYHRNISEHIPGPTTGLLCELSIKHQIHLCCGLSEKSDGGFYNTQVLTNPKGEIQAIHRKWNLKTGERRAGYNPGLEPVTVTKIKDIKTGMIICSDAAHPRTMRELAKNKLELILYSLSDDKDEQWFMAKANSRLYDAWIISANRFGQESRYWNGHTVISDPLGRLRTTLINQEGYLGYTLQFPRSRSTTQRMIRNLYVKTPLLIHILKSWKTLSSYYE